MDRQSRWWLRQDEEDSACSHALLPHPTSAFSSLDHPAIHPVPIHFSLLLWPTTRSLHGSDLEIGATHGLLESQLWDEGTNGTKMLDGKRKNVHSKVHTMGMDVLAPVRSMAAYCQIEPEDASGGRCREELPRA